MIPADTTSQFQVITVVEELLFCTVDIVNCISILSLPGSTSCPPSGHPPWPEAAKRNLEKPSYRQEVRGTGGLLSGNLWT